jgi:hypothetical protein
MDGVPVGAGLTLCVSRYTVALYSYHGVRLFGWSFARIWWWRLVIF